jgi:ABC-type branched-subunit amino acid transport system substrate-binding protein
MRFFRHLPGIIAAALMLCTGGPALAAEIGVTNDVVVLGQSCALTGPAQELGSEMRLGAQAYFNQVNQAGGVHGRQIKLVTLDDGYEPDRAAANTKKLINEEKVFSLFGYVGTPTSNASLPIFTEAKVPFFGAFTGAESLRNPFNRYIFNVRASYFDETEKIVEQLTSLGVRNIAVFYQNDAYGQAGLAGVERALTKRNMKIVSTATVERNTVAVDAAVKTLAPKQPDVIVMISAYKSIAAFVKAAKKACYTGQFHNVSFVGSRALAEELGPEGYGVAISQVMPFPFASSLPVVRDYLQAMKLASSAQASFTSLEGYVAARVFVEGLKRAGKDLTRDKFIAALETLNYADIGGFNVNFTPKSHNGSTYVDLTMIGRNKSFVR